MQTSLIITVISLIGSTISHLSDSVSVAYVMGGVAMVTILLIVETDDKKENK